MREFHPGEPAGLEPDRETYDREEAARFVQSYERGNPDPAERRALFIDLAARERAEVIVSGQAEPKGPDLTRNVRAQLARTHALLDAATKIPCGPDAPTAEAIQAVMQEASREAARVLDPMQRDPVHPMDGAADFQARLKAEADAMRARLAAARENRDRDHGRDR